MKGLLVLLTASLMLVVGCSTTQAPTATAPVAQAPIATTPVITEPVPVTVSQPVVVETTTTAPRTSGNARIDAAAFLQALIESGCVIDRAEYKEVARGGGISVECADDTDILESKGLGDL